MSILLQISSVLGRDGVRVPSATAGIDTLAVRGAPVGEGVGVDVRLDDDFAMSETTLAQFLGCLFPLVESRGEFATVREDRFETLVVRLLIPRKTYDEYRF